MSPEWLAALSPAQRKCWDELGRQGRALFERVWFEVMRGETAIGYGPSVPELMLKGASDDFVELD